MGRADRVVSTFFQALVRDPAKSPPEDFVQELPTVTTMTVGNRVRGAGANLTAGSHYIGAGSTWRITRIWAAAGSAESWLSVYSTREGTLGFLYFPSRGQQLIHGESSDPLLTLTPGTIQLTFLSAGSAQWFAASLEGVQR